MNIEKNMESEKKIAIQVRVSPETVQQIMDL